MADYYTMFSVILNLPDETAQEYALNLACLASQIRFDDNPPADFPKGLAEVLESWFFETDANCSGESGLWLHSEEGGIDAVCAFIQHLLQKFDPTAQVTFEWANDCSKPRTDAYGGGAAIITATKIKTMNTGQWLQQNASPVTK